MINKLSLNFSLKKPAIKQEWTEFHRIQKTEIIDPKPDIIYNYDHPDLKKPNFHIFLFYKNSKIIGIASTEQLNKNIWALRSLAIDERQKNKGLGTILIKMVEFWIKQQAATTIKLHSNHKAFNFYKRNGYKKMPFKENKPRRYGQIDMGKYL